MKYNRYTKNLHNKIKQLNLNYEDTGGLLVCLYLYGGCSEEDCAKLFEFTLDSIIDYLKYEEIYGYKICSKCEKLKDRNDIQFKRSTGQKISNICTECRKIRNKKYRQNHFEIRQNYMKEYHEKYKEKLKEQSKLYYLENKEKIKFYRKENKEKIKKYNKKYYLENKDIIQEYHKKNKKKLKEQQKLYNLENKEKLQEYRKEYYNSSTSEELLQRLEMYEEVNRNQIKCKYCGDWYTPTIQEVHNRLKGISNNDTGYIYCSEECKEACPIYKKVLYSKDFKPASSREVNPVLRQLVFERDQYTCQKCFNHKDELNCPLHCHHITPYIDSPIEGNDPENCITLCKDCHKEVHQIPGCGYAELRCG